MKKSSLRSLAALVLALLLLFGAACAEAALDLPAMLDYADDYNWSYWADGEAKPCDLFIVAPTVDMGKDGNILADIDNESYRTNFTGALNMQLGIYRDVCTVYAPYYHQVAFPVYSYPYEEAKPIFDYAYEEVSAAFAAYLSAADAERPLIVAGFSQGGDMAIRLAKEYFADEAMQRRLVAVYAIGWRLTDEELAEYPHLCAAQGETDTGVIVMFNTEAESITGSALVPEGVKTYAINPLNWRTDGTPADASLNLGACFTDYGANITNEIPNFCGAYLDDVRGTLKAPDVDPAAYPGKIFPDGVYHIYDYQFFFRNLQKNVADRLAAWAQQ